MAATSTAGGPARWRIRRVEQTGSTNADLAVCARAGTPEGEVLVAGHQTAGRGRMARGWSSPAGTGLTFSVLLRPAPVPVSRWGWLSCIAGLAVVDAVEPLVGEPTRGAVGEPTRGAVGEPTGGQGTRSRARATLKWPNDVLLDGLKTCGILSEVELGPSPAAVLGIGVNVAPLPGQLPPTATSVSAATGRDVAPEDLLMPVLTALDRWYEPWRVSGGDADSVGLRSAYRGRSATLGNEVTVRFADEHVDGVVTDIDSDGRLVLRTEDGESRVFGSGDVVHATLR